MIVMKRLFTGLLIVCLLCTLAACASEKDTIHPPEFQKLSSLIAAPMEEFYQQTGLTEADLTKLGGGLYKTPLTVTFASLPFSVSQITVDPINGYLMGFTYETPLTGDPKTDAKTLQSLGQHFTAALGPAHSDAYSEPDVTRFGDMTVAELEQKLSTGDFYNSDYWSLGPWNTENMTAYLPILLSTEGAVSLPDEGEIPILLFHIEAGYHASGEKVLRLVYTMNWTWQSVENSAG